MAKLERIERRLSAVERTLTGETDLDTEMLEDALALSADVAALEERLDDLEERIANLEGDIESIGGYLSEVDSVNEEVERHALSAVSGLDRAEDRLDELEAQVQRLDTPDGSQETVDQAMARSGSASEGGTVASEVDVEEQGKGEGKGEGEREGRSTIDRIFSVAEQSNGDSPAEPADSDAGEYGATDTTVASAVGEGGNASNGDGSGERDRHEGGDAVEEMSRQQRVKELFENGGDEEASDEGGFLDGIRERFS